MNKLKEYLGHAFSPIPSDLSCISKTTLANLFHLEGFDALGPSHSQRRQQLGRLGEKQKPKTRTGGGVPPNIALLLFPLTAYLAAAFRDGGEDCPGQHQLSSLSSKVAA